MRSLKIGPERKHRFTALARVFIFQFTLLTGIFVVARLVMFQAYAGSTVEEATFQELLFTWLLGLRYDFRIALVFLSPLMLAGLAGVFFRRAESAFTFFLSVWSALTALAAVAASAGNFYYYCLIA